MKENIKPSIPNSDRKEGVLFTPEERKQIDRDIKTGAYRDGTHRLAEEINKQRQLIEKIFGKKISPEDITRVDAELELIARKRAEGKGPESFEVQYLDRVVNSDLFLEEGPMENFDGKKIRIIKLEGKIDGKDVVLEDRLLNADDYDRRSFEGPFTKRPFVDYTNDRKGLINNDYIPKNEIFKLLFDYYEIAKNRTEEIKKLFNPTSHWDPEDSFKRSQLDSEAKFKERW